MVDLSSPSLRTEEAGAAASKVSVHPAVRTRLLTLQRQMAYEPPPSFNGAVLDGRDIGAPRLLLARSCAWITLCMLLLHVYVFEHTCRWALHSGFLLVRKRTS